MAIRAVIVEDELLSCIMLNKMLDELGCEVISVFHTGNAFIEWYLQCGQKLDVLFLDICMPGITGIEIPSYLESAPPIIFTTSYTNYAIKAFELKALDCLEKPFTKERLIKALERLDTYSRCDKIIPFPARLKIKVGNASIILMDFAKISHFELDENKHGVVYACRGKERFRLAEWQCLNQILEAFASAQLLRIQRHILIKPEAITGYMKLGGGRMKITITGGVEFNVSRNATSLLAKRLNKECR